MNGLSVFAPRFSSDIIEAMDRNFANDFSAFPPMPKLAVPKVDVCETKNSYVLEMDLPGFSEEDVEINLKDRVLSVSSKKDETKEEKKNGEWLIKERHTMNFARRFTLPNDINSEKVTATFKNGVLIIEVPRKPESQAKTISITAKK